MGKYLDLIPPRQRTRACSDVLQDGPAVALVCRLEAEGFDIALDGARISVKPGDRLSAADRLQLSTHEDSVAMLIRICDEGVQARRAVFAQQLASAPTGMPSFVLDATRAPEPGTCVSCGTPLGQSRMGRCWRCVVAWRLAAGVGIPARLPELRVEVAV